VITDALTVAIDTTGYLEVDTANEAVAAAALVGVAMGDRGLAPKSDQASRLGDIEFGPATAALALRAIDRVLEPDSELAQLWGESGVLDPDFSAWMDRIRQALR
jgi:hypothetical protein